MESTMGLDMYLRASEYVYRHNFNRQTDEDTINPLFNEIVKHQFDD